MKLSEEHKAKISASLKGRKNTSVITEDGRKRISESNTRRNKEMWKDPYYRANMIRKIKDNDNRPEMKEILSKSMKSTNQKRRTDPTLKLKSSKLAVRLNLDPKSKFGKRKGNRCRYNGVTMRSSWETRFASELDKLGVSWTYEPTHFTFSNCESWIPDFYIPIKDLYIEIKPKIFLKDCEHIPEFLLTEFNKKCIIVTEDNWDAFIKDL